MRNKTIFFLVLFSTLSSAADLCFDITKPTKITQFDDFTNSGYVKTENDKYRILSGGFVNGGFGGAQAVEDGLVYLYDKENKKIVKVPKKSNEYPYLTKDNQLALIETDYSSYSSYSSEGNQEKKDKQYLESLKKTKIKIYDIKTGNFKNVVGKFLNLKGELLEPQSVSRNGVAFSIISKNLNTGKIETTNYNQPGSLLNDEEHNISIKIDPDKSSLAFYQNDIRKNDYKLSPETIQALTGTQGYNGASAISPSGKLVSVNLTTSSDFNPTTLRKYLFYNTKENNFKDISLPNNSILDLSSKSNLSSDEKHVLVKTFNTTAPTQVLNLETGATTELGNDSLKDPKFNEKNEVCGIVSSDNGNRVNFTHRYVCYDLNGKKVSSKTLPSDGRDVVYLSPNLIIERKTETTTKNFSFFNYSTYSEVTNILEIEQNCVKALQFENCNCDVNEQLKNTEYFVALQTKLLCQSNYDANAWDNILPYSDKLSEKNAVLWLKKLSKMNSFNPDKDLPIIKTIIDNGINQKYQSEFKAAAISIMLSHPAIYNQLEEANPKAFDFENVNPSSDCLSESEAKTQSVKLHEDLLQKVKAITNLSNSNLSPILEKAKKYLNDDQKEKLADILGDKAVELMGNDTDLKNIFSSKVYKFAYNNFKKQLGLDYKDLTDVTVIQDQGQIKVYQLGVDKLQGGRETQGGFSLKLTKSININEVPKNHSEKMDWNYNGKPFSANINLSREENAQEFISNATSPDYKSMKEHGGIRGLVIAGSNLGDKLTQDVVGEYLEYYSGQGFDFDEAAPVDNMKSFFASRMAGPERATYLVKEAHSDGDEKNLFRMSTQGKILKGVKTNGDGSKEYIEIVYPGSNPESVLLSNKDFGELMKKREANNDPELVYLNSSCWSHTKATYEIAAARSKKLIEIPTLTSMETFYNDYHSAMYSVIHGIRTEQPYSKIREDLQSDSKYSKGVGNIVLFPDEERFKTIISDKIKIPVSIDTEITTLKDGKQVPYSIEQDGH